MSQVGESLLHNYEVLSSNFSATTGVFGFCLIVMRQMKMKHNIVNL
jgi:hypothetical protein